MAKPPPPLPQQQKGLIHNSDLNTKSQAYKKTRCFSATLILHGWKTKLKLILPASVGQYVHKDELYLNSFFNTSGTNMLSFSLKYKPMSKCSYFHSAFYSTKMFTVESSPFSLNSEFSPISSLGVQGIDGMQNTCLQLLCLFLLDFLSSLYCHRSVDLVPFCTSSSVFNVLKLIIFPLEM